MKNWNDKILEGMKLIKEGCRENPSWIDCSHCPFDSFCTIIQQARREQIACAYDADLPSEWFEEKEEELS